jgi:hypothetical protein
MAISTRLNGFPDDEQTKPSVLRSMITPRNHKRSPSAGLVLSSARTENINPNDPNSSNTPSSTLLYHPYSIQPLEIVNPNRERARSSPRKPASKEQHLPPDNGRSLHKKTKSSVSLRSLVGGDRDNKSSIQDTAHEAKPKKTKSSTNLAALLSRPKSSKSHKSEVLRVTKDKENQTPPNSAGSGPPPIWAQYASSQPLQETSTATGGRVNDRMSVDEEMALYTPKDYSPSKQRNFCDYQQPTLARRPELKPRPKSAYLPSTPSLAALADTLSGRRKVSNDRSIHPAPRKDLGRGHDHSSEDKGRGSSEQEYSNRRPGGEGRKVSSELIKEGVTLAKRGVRVMAAVAALNGKSIEQEKDVKVDTKSIDNAFEALLVSPASMC